MMPRHAQVHEGEEFACQNQVARQNHVVIRVELLTRLGAGAISTDQEVVVQLSSGAGAAVFALQDDGAALQIVALRIKAQQCVMNIV